MRRRNAQTGVKGGIARTFHGSHSTYTLAHEVTGETLWFCATCGQYTQIKMCGMANQCLGPRPHGSPAWHALNKLRSGLHPGLRRRLNPVPPAHWGTPIKGVHKLIGNLPLGTPTGSQPMLQVLPGNEDLPYGSGTLPCSTSRMRSEAASVDPEPDPFGLHGIYGSDMQEEDDLGLDQGSFFGMDDQFLI